MLITRILNNNVVFSVNEAKEEVIVTGLGVGFKKKLEMQFLNNKSKKYLLRKKIPLITDSYNY
ncbi:CAT RNA binding domain-containing protein [Listeria monocytogenes]|nr:CAT RNA binding domain-containing protein [Listeria monocytogenes]EKA2555625.1 CAT RNA binding domain-containing protein [Listeria monocytogenes]EKA2558769.1 CAT RNA binding domain-containing protein [Listeria monocytogenes]EKA2561893.1 CAT RNA binding domain-containing protein [Listeria monocytogenes]EKA2565074.1 CAT RNA binding domain-containing protein [Listeria monocytogenes]